MNIIGWSQDHQANSFTARLNVMVECKPIKRTISVHKGRFISTGNPDPQYYHGQFPWTYFIVNILVTETYKLNELLPLLAENQFQVHDQFITGNYQGFLCGNSIFTSSKMKQRFDLTNDSLSICMGDEDTKSTSIFLYDFIKEIVESFYSKSFSYHENTFNEARLSEWTEGKSLYWKGTTPLSGKFEFQQTSKNHNLNQYAKTWL